MKRNPSRVISTTLALLLGLTLAMPGTGFAAGTPAPVIISDPAPAPDERASIQEGAPAPDWEGSTAQRPTLTAAELSVTLVTEDCGSVDNDRVAYVDESCTVTVRVTDSASSAAVSGATVTLDQTTAMTDSQGNASLKITALPVGYNPIVATSGARQSIPMWFFAVIRGTGLFWPYLYDKDGNSLVVYQLNMTNENGPNGSTVYFRDIREGFFAGTFPAGQYQARLAAQAAPGEGYVMDLAEVNVPEGTVNRLTVDGGSTLPVTVTASLDGAPVSGAGVWLTSTDIYAYTHYRSVTTTQADGMAVIYAFPGSYDAAVMGGTPKVFGVQQVTVENAPVATDIALTQTATLHWAPQSYGAVTEGWVSLSTATRKDYFLYDTSATLLVDPGSYVLRGGVTVTDTEAAWDYSFYGLPGPGAAARMSYPFQAGQSYNLTGAGPWGMRLAVPQQLSLGETGWFSFSLIGSDAEIYRIWRYPLDLGPSSSAMTTAIKDPAGTTVGSNEYASLTWTATAPDGRYSFAAQANPGPFFSQTFPYAASADFLVGTTLGIDFAPNWVAGTKVLPGGLFSLFPRIFDLPTSVEGLTLEILYDPSQVTFDSQASAAGNGSILEGNGSLRWTWTKGTVEPELPTLVFEAVPGFFGGAQFTAGPNSTITVAGVTKSLSSLDRYVPVAKNAVMISVPGNVFPTAAVATDGVNSQWAVRYADSTSATPFEKIVFLDLPVEMGTAVVMAPLYLTQEVPIQPPETGMVTVEVPLRYGDVDSSGLVNESDLSQIADAVPPPGQNPQRHDLLFDVNMDDEVDIVEVVLAARNFGATDSVSTPRGTLVVSLDVTSLDTPQAAQLLVRHGTPADLMAPAGAHLALVPGQTTSKSFSSLPPGAYRIQIYLADGSIVISDQFVIEDGMITEIQLDL